MNVFVMSNFNRTPRVTLSSFSHLLSEDNRRRQDLFENLVTKVKEVMLLFDDLFIYI